MPENADVSEVPTINKVRIDEDGLQTLAQRIVVRSCALGHAVQWANFPGADVVGDILITAVWFEDFLLNGEQAVLDELEKKARKEEETPKADFGAFRLLGESDD